MAEKILYYIGAGASALALPLARSVWDPEIKIVPKIPKIAGLAYSLKELEIDKIFNAFNEPQYYEYKEKLKQNLTELSLKADEFGDVDTYAKYLYLKSSEELDKVKRILSQYFSLAQIFQSKLDRRYLPWLISIMETGRFPDNVKILNWNYDFQIELAATNFGKIEEVSHSNNGYSYSPSFITHYPSLDPNPDNRNDLSIIHLNGIAGFVRPKEFYTSSIFQSSVRESNLSLINYVINEEHSPLIHFAWEKSHYHKSLMEKVKTMITGTTIIVVIGYSFPFFNREIDKVIFGNLMSSGTIKKIYYQDPVLTGEQLRAQFLLNPDLPIVHIKEVDNFHIPFEY